ncbi:hypothetical protein [Raoultibacter phocaeensis]|uniref:hypothetical protein n=1 Tax=Raoultibacter phocaeensis TaxID=2479841 RepID=UPI00111B0423|nr:hypothetical protein [Raoultibacter phocaeensis]
MYSPYVIHIGPSCCGCGACVRQCVRDNFALAGDRRTSDSAPLDDRDGGGCAATDDRAEAKKDYVCVGCMACVKWCPTHALIITPAKPVSAYIRAR